MSTMGKEIRIRRVLVGGNALIVAMDHGTSSGPVAGLKDIRKAVVESVAAMSILDLMFVGGFL